MELFPYEYQGNQRDIVDAIRDSVSHRRSLVLESGTGTGKTIVSLTGALEAILGTGSKLIYLTRTKSQQKQVIREVREISKRRSIVCIGIQGRDPASCPMMRDDLELRNGTSDELSRLCSEFKKDEGHGPACEFFANAQRANIGEVLEFFKREHPTPEEFMGYCHLHGFCYYELAKALLPSADVITVPYPFIFMPQVRMHFIQWVGVPLSNCVLIIDEAHNLTSYLREVMTIEYTSMALSLAEREAREWNDPMILDGTKVTDVISVFKDCMDHALSEYLVDEDGIVPPYFLQEELMYRMRASSRSIGTMVKGLLDIGETVRNEKKSRKKLPRSYIGSFGAFLQEWMSTDEDSHVCLINGGENPWFQSYCLDPSIAADPLRTSRSTVLMSGTLEPLESFATEIGLHNYDCHRFPSPFPKENLKVVYVDDVSSKYEELNGENGMFEMILEHVLGVIGSIERNTAIFFPSYSIMDRAIGSGFMNGVKRDLFIERRGMSQIELMGEVDSFRRSKAGILLAITGGRISEGLDFPGDDMEVAIIVGIPYPRPTMRHEALQRYCNRRFGDGWEYASRIPTMRKMRQAIGRLIRSPTDRGLAILLDRRVHTMPELNASLTDDLCGEAQGFFRS